ncbi:hypothetical protein AGMMS50239_16190 [Bacteroidia bacterium]|nr:hypothetical protein AGMMS50239_16190 [Bacteroidia bacterium]
MANTRKKHAVPQYERVQGAVVGFALGAAWQFAPFVPYIGRGVQTIMTYYAYGQVGLGVLGTAAGAFNDGWKGVGNGAKTFLCNFYMDENNWLGGTWQGFSRLDRNKSEQTAEKYFRKHYGVNWTFQRYPLN